MSDDLTAWLREQYDAAEADTRTRLHWAQQTIIALQEPRLLGREIPGWHEWPDVEKLCRQHLAELDATRRIAETHSPWIASSPHVVLPIRCRECGDIDEAPVAWPCSTLRLLALPHAAKPGYRDEWRPQ